MSSWAPLVIGFQPDPVLLVVLAVIAFLSGIGITTIGPGGIFLTAALYALTPISSSEVAGTAHATFIATGIVGSIAYVRSGELRTGESRALVVILSASSIAGALAGSALNAFVSRALFGLLLGGVATAVGGLIWYREWHGLEPRYLIDPGARRDRALLAVLGFSLGVCSGLVGIGGPVLAVPALILLGVPMLVAVAVAQVQSIFIAVFATTGYFLQGSVIPSLAVFVGSPLLLGVVVGWRLAHLIDPDRLKVALGVALVGVGLSLAL
ncbi:sulfite exporter TauE/SafE family protein [Natronoglomus mannanivorans]|uniref:Probable membrane transporter protein n=1 Tax=Natronoglomus mannanivorans TaxID=2979990 RepID=A0AAP3E3P1_9EURY|nr:sulfite exporter TauE/SafE family protein [Halobacteria archaeon AArc-xg1-1]